MADYTIKQGDSAPPIVQQLTNADGSIPNLTGATVRFNARSLTGAAALTLTGTVSTPDPANGTVRFSPTAADTATAGEYQVTWTVGWPAGTQTTYPAVGYYEWTIEPNLAAEGQQLVSLAQVKGYMASFGLNGDRLHDNKLLGYIQAVTPLIENIAGPIIVRQFDEWHDGGEVFIRLRRRPSTFVGSQPVLALIACSEYVGPIEWPLAIIDTPDKGQLYSCQLDIRTGRVVRRTAGGGVQPFPAMPQAVHAVYQAGQQVVPQNVVEAACELIRVNYQTTMTVGTGAQTVADVDERGDVPMGFFIPRRVKELLAPMRRFPAIA